jgi:hypothetical protein
VYYNSWVYLFTQVKPGFILRAPGMIFVRLLPVLISAFVLRFENEWGLVCEPLVFL